mmetsp:Transcript_11249/g.22597  ORF Transcript_11249/g.22597 Transcript_11249/m.22597 type:complete len:213 (+) Transcript_11249:340-978(+)
MRKRAATGWCSSFSNADTASVALLSATILLKAARRLTTLRTSLRSLSSVTLSQSISPGIARAHWRRTKALWSEEFCVTSTSSARTPASTTEKAGTPPRTREELEAALSQWAHLKSTAPSNTSSKPTRLADSSTATARSSACSFGTWATSRREAARDLCSSQIWPTEMRMATTSVARVSTSVTMEMTSLMFQSSVQCRTSSASSSPAPFSGQT